MPPSEGYMIWEELQAIRSALWWSRVACAFFAVSFWILLAMIAHRLRRN